MTVSYQLKQHTPNKQTYACWSSMSWQVDMHQSVMIVAGLCCPLQFSQGSSLLWSNHAMVLYFRRGFKWFKKLWRAFNRVGNQKWIVKPGNNLALLHFCFHRLEVDGFLVNRSICLTLNPEVVSGHFWLLSDFCSLWAHLSCISMETAQ